MNLRTWLRKDPPAVSVRITTDDGAKVVKINPKDERRWARAEETIRQYLGPGVPLLVEALDRAGDVLRTTQLDPPPAEPGETAEEDAGPNVELAQLGKLLVTAQKSGAEHHEKAYKTAFDMLHGLVKSVVDANNANIKLVNNLLRRVANAEAAMAGAGGDATDDVPGMLFNMVMGRQQPAKNGATNGNGAHAGGMPDMSAMQDVFKQAVKDAVAEELKNRDDDQGDDGE